MKKEHVFTTVVNCARCCDTHLRMEFKPFQYPVERKWTHWAMCPETNEPILLQVGKVKNGKTSDTE